MLPRSPAWRCASVGAACGIPPGLKCPPAEEASGAEQSPLSWTWSPWVPGGAFSMWTTTATPPVDRSVKVAHPFTFDPLRGSIVALAWAPAGVAAAVDVVDVVDVDEHPATARAVPATSAS